jgi:hypothetical protein
MALNAFMDSDIINTLQVSIVIIRNMPYKARYKEHGIYAAPGVPGRPFNKANEILTPG